MNTLLRRHAVISHAVFARTQPTGLRTFTTSHASYEQHLLWSGTLLDQTTDTFKPLDQDLLLAAGAGPDLLKGDVSLLPPAASPTRGHSLLPYRTAQPEAWSRVLAIGRNTHAQLGIGYASQEATFGLIRSGYSGKGGISKVVAGQHQSWILTDDESKTAIEGTFACGNNTLGQLAEVMVEESGQQPLLLLIPAPKRVFFAAKADAILVEQVALGLDHVVGVATSQDDERSSQWRSNVVTCGLNTDGQLGRKLEPHLIDDHLSQTHSRAFSELGLYTEGPTRDEAAQWQIAAGGDTSYAWTAERVYAWGNNEYGQCLGAQEELGDQVATPKDVTNQLRVAMGSKVKLKDVKILGSCVLFLDGEYCLYCYRECDFDPRMNRRGHHTRQSGSGAAISTGSSSLDSFCLLSSSAPWASNADRSRRCSCSAMSFP